MGTSLKSTCFACMEVDNVYSVFEKENDGHESFVAVMLKETFSIDLPADPIYMVCGICILKLRKSFIYKRNIIDNIKEINRLSQLNLDYADDISNQEDDYEIESEVDPKTGCLKFYISENDKQINNITDKEPNNSQDNVENNNDEELTPIETNEKNKHNKETVTTSTNGLKTHKDQRLVPVLFKENQVIIDASIQQTIQKEQNERNIKQATEKDLFKTRKVDPNKKITILSQEVIVPRNNLNHTDDAKAQNNSSLNKTQNIKVDPSKKITILSEEVIVPKNDLDLTNDTEVQNAAPLNKNQDIIISFSNGQDNSGSNSTPILKEQHDSPIKDTVQTNNSNDMIKENVDMSCNNISNSNQSEEKLQEGDNSETFRVKFQDNEDNTGYDNSNETIEYGNSDVCSEEYNDVINGNSKKQGDREITPITYPTRKARSILKKKMAETETESVFGSTVKKQKVKKSIRFLDDFKIEAPKSGLSMNQIFKLKPGQLHCDICTQHFESTRTLHKHMLTHYGNFKCDECDGKFLTKAQLKRHKGEVHLKGPFVCTICDELFEKYNTRNAHISRVHKKNRLPQACPQCKERFKTYNERLAHLRDVHGVPEKKYKCPYCENQYTTAGSRSKHVRFFHFRELKYKCSLCPMVFAQRRDVEKHLAARHFILEGKMKMDIHQCPVCDAKFKIKAVLKCHMKCHEFYDAVDAAGVASESVLEETVVNIDYDALKGDEKLYFEQDTLNV